MKDELVLTLCKVNSKNEPDIPGDEAKISSVTHARSNSFSIRHRFFGFFFYIWHLPSKNFQKQLIVTFFFLVCTLLFWGFNVFFCLSEQTFVTIRYR